MFIGLILPREHTIICINTVPVPLHNVAGQPYGVLHSGAGVAHPLQARRDGDDLLDGLACRKMKYSTVWEVECGYRVRDEREKLEF